QRAPAHAEHLVAAFAAIIGAVAHGFAYLLAHPRLEFSENLQAATRGHPLRSSSPAVSEGQSPRNLHSRVHSRACFTRRDLSSAMMRRRSSLLISLQRAISS